VEEDDGVGADLLADEATRTRERRRTAAAYLGSLAALV
jgi:hypothetical protein